MKEAQKLLQSNGRRYGGSVQEVSEETLLMMFCPVEAPALTIKNANEILGCINIILLSKLNKIFTTSNQSCLCLPYGICGVMSQFKKNAPKLQHIGVTEMVKG